MEQSVYQVSSAYKAHILCYSPTVGPWNINQSLLSFSLSHLNQHSRRLLPLSCLPLLLELLGYQDQSTPA